MGKMKIAKEMILLAKDAGADAVKTQYYQMKDLTYPCLKTRNEVQKVRLNLKQLKSLKKHAENLGIDFICTPFVNPKLIDDLEKIGLKTYKVREADSDKQELIDRITKTGKPFFISTTKLPENLSLLYNPRITWLGCIPRYPPAPEDLDLGYLSCCGGFSDHFPNITASLTVAALALKVGRERFVIEKHVTRSHDDPVLDAAVSIDFNELNDLVKHVRRMEKYSWEKTVW